MVSISLVASLRRHNLDTRPIKLASIASRFGFTTRPIHLRKLLQHLASIDLTPPVPNPPTGTPTLSTPQISVTFSGNMQDAKFHVTGSGFLPNRPPNSQGVAIRVVDAQVGIETRREFTDSSNQGTIDTIIEGDISGLVVNALGVATIAFSATDGRLNPADATGFLWSNTVRIPFSA
jgi:hypothetical protein